MSYTKEMCLYLLDNPDNIEAESLTESVERQVFQAMNKAISMRVGDRTPWRGRARVYLARSTKNLATYPPLGE